ncbi:MAG TPA: septation protein SepH [Microlunatus sp.]|nr:septation protein SepH [Microlunatus sp.]
MRRARLVGLSPDGRSLIVATDDGEHLEVPADDRLRAAVRGHRPRLGQLEIEMESGLSPREIQTRIRSGESLEDVAKVAGIPMERVERFAAPVIAEREYVAAQAVASTVRRRGETSGHRNLRLTITERLISRGVDVDTLAWDSYRMEDGRWAVTADYRSGDAARQALFYYDVQGRFSIAGNDDARWILGEQTAARGQQPGRRRPDGSAATEDDVEPTVDLSDELAIVRAVQEPPVAPAAVVEAEILAEVAELRGGSARDGSARDGSARDGSARDGSGADPGTTGRNPDERSVELARETALAEAEFDQAGLEGTSLGRGRRDDVLDDMLSRSLAEESAIAYPGLSDASAVPEAASRRGAGWEPAIVVNFPVEPSQIEPADEYGGPLQGTDEPEPGLPALADLEDEAEALEDEVEALEEELEEPQHGGPQPGAPQSGGPQSGAPESGAPESGAPESGESNASDPAASAGGVELMGETAPDVDTPGTEAAADEPAPDVPAEPAAAKPSRRRRASVPSWDEIMFGAPKRP